MDVRQQKAEVMQSLLTVVLDDQASAQDRAEARSSLRRIADGSVIETLGRIVDETPDDGLLTELSEVLSGVVNSTDTIAPMIQFLWHDAAEVRHAAMKSLSRSGSKEAAGAMAILLSDSRHGGTIFDSSDERLARRSRDSILGRAVG